MPPPKVKWGNLMNKRWDKPKVPKHKQIGFRNWTIFTGDTVEVTRGPDAGKRGEVLSTIMKQNRVVVRDVNMHVKHIKPNPEQLQGARVTREAPIPVQDVVLIDPVTQTPTSVKLVQVFNEVKGRNVTQRLLDSQTVIEIPEKQNPFKDRKAGPLDTKAADVGEVTWTPNIKEVPFPAAFLNQLEKWRRHGREGQAF